MSEAQDTGKFNVETILAGIERDLAEAGKLRRESEKFIAEQQKLMTESQKLFAERQKLDRDRWLAPWLAMAGLIGGLVSIATLIMHALAGR